MLFLVFYIFAFSQLRLATILKVNLGLMLMYAVSALVWAPVDSSASASASDQGFIGLITGGGAAADLKQYKYTWLYKCKNVLPLVFWCCMLAVPFWLVEKVRVCVRCVALRCVALPCVALR